MNLNKLLEKSKAIVEGKSLRRDSSKNQLQQSHSKILANLSRNFQEFKDDVKELKQSLGCDEMQAKLNEAKTEGILKKSASARGEATDQETPNRQLAPCSDEVYMK